jgi:hypothetical protein
MYHFEQQLLSEYDGLRFAISKDGRPLSYGDVIDAWQNSKEFREQFSEQLADSPYKAFRWETPAVTRTMLAQPLEFVLLNSPRLERPVEPEAFAEHFQGATGPVVSFANLGRDAIMVVPCPLTDEKAYGHLAAFVRRAPVSQQHALWQEIGDAMAKRVDDVPVWLSTAGAGVSWLHVRLDDRPKYYGYEPYRQPIK